MIPKLGYWNVFYLIWYRVSLKSGLRKNWFKIAPPVEGIFFRKAESKTDYPGHWEKPLIDQAEKIMQGKHTWFSSSTFPVGILPPWFYNPFTQTTFSDATNHWTELNDFDQEVGDIKIIWEISRFDWLTVLARAYKVTGEHRYLEQINALLNDWSKENPLNRGPNWKCGQEASIRIMKLLTTAFILDQFLDAESSLKKLIFQHVSRVVANINYAIAQDNNHGTSEAGALYIGSRWLIKNGFVHNQLEKWSIKGRRILEERVLKIIQPDGSFSQRSMNYHRVAVDTLSWVLHLQGLLGEQPYNHKITERLQKLGEWQFKMTLGKNGEAPNFGNNDGSLYENLHSQNYTDYRISSQLFFGALMQKRVYKDNQLSESLFWRFGKEALRWPLHTIPIPDVELLDRQILLLRKKEATVFCKIPDDTFRPGNDAFHIDFWYKGINVIRDNGTYSYSSNETEWFKSVAAHNTVQFGNHDQMPTISRFLLGDWIKPKQIGEIFQSDDELSWQGSYLDYKGNEHQRKISLTDSELEITDNIQANEEAKVHYHLQQKNIETLGIKINYPDSTKIEQSMYAAFYMHKTTDDALVIPFENDQTKITIRFGNIEELVN